MNLYRCFILLVACNFSWMVGLLFSCLYFRIRHNIIIKKKRFGMQSKLVNTCSVWFTYHMVWQLGTMHDVWSIILYSHNIFLFIFPHILTYTDINMCPDKFHRSILTQMWCNLKSINLSISQWHWKYCCSLSCEKCGWLEARRLRLGGRRNNIQKMKTCANQVK